MAMRYGVLPHEIINADAYEGSLDYLIFMKATAK